MNIFKNPFSNNRTTANLELVLLRSYVVFEIAAKLFMLSVEQLREAAQKLGLI